ncbi:uncharacterized protein LOC124413222 isoform X1 [Diprion similis]|uniref:uncharacterized protein LOC124413222 isoform X1 n=1 Tax=Diprion similis TaxID=362088 RepID=UPI001EF8F561|nr:uncharacterized protein LOC124413222 isoform X1 [Diprion similis]
MLRPADISTKHTRHGRTLTRFNLTLANFIVSEMKFTWILYILSCALFVANCAPTTENPSLDVDGSELKKVGKDGAAAEEEERQETLDDVVDLGSEGGAELPILPPIILIDFTNGTNLTSEEKSKRTINGNLGYGFQSNNILSGKYNYYLPAGKTGTKVSIEESISPFLPTTIIEKVNDAGPYSNLFGSPVQSHNQPRANPVTPLAFGQRTKLQKTNSQSFQSFSGFGATQKPNYVSYSTPRPEFQSNIYPVAPVGLGSYGNQASGFNGFTSPRPPVYNNPSPQTQYQYQNQKTYNSPIQNYDSFLPTPGPTISANYATPKPQSYSDHGQTTVLSALGGNSPKYSFENGVRYEHKIVWKYPDGMVSEVGPSSYDGSYSGYSSPTKISLTSNYPKSDGNGYSASSGGIYSQKPATFPNSEDSDEGDSKANQFVSSASISSSNPGYFGSPSQATQPSLKFGYQNTYSASSGQSGSLGKPGVQDTKPVSSYPVDSPQPEYPPLQSYSIGQDFEALDSQRTGTYTFQQPSNPGSDSLPGKTPSTTVLSKYKPQVQQYLKKALGLEGAGKSQEYQTTATGPSTSSSSSPSSLQYSSLLDYNPSLSQYISNPASILNAQPTFVQAGNSLIPVIILRVDGVAPIQPKATPNINLKALLQKYLTQYAQTVTNLAKSQGYDQGYEVPDTQGSSGPELYDLGRLTQSLSQLRQGSNFKQNFAHNFAQSIAGQSYQPSTLSSQSSYGEFEKGEYSNLQNAKYVAPRKHKVKNVEIIDDPRFTTYKVKN